MKDSSTLINSEFRKSLAVLIACHNRRENTLKCLKCLFEQNLPDNFSVKIFLVDDGSVDGTSEDVRKYFPQVHILEGDGNLYWTGGMSLAHDVASKESPDFYLWLNDDMHLYKNALIDLLDTYSELELTGCKNSIVVGSAEDPEGQCVSYGGMRRKHWWNPIKYSLVTPNKLLQSCDSMNGNCVLIPRCVDEIVGELDAQLRHYAADIDYGLRAVKLGCSIWVSSDYVGECKCEGKTHRWWDGGLSFAERVKSVNHPKGMAFREWRVFTKRHAGFLWPLFFILPYRRLFF